MSEIRLTIIDRDGAAHALVARTGQVLMHLARDEVDLDTGICGGEISCGTCVVQLCPEWAGRIPPPGEDEAEMLEALGVGDNARLGCQVTLCDAADGMQATLVHED